MVLNKWIKEGKFCTIKYFTITQKVCNLYSEEYDRGNNRLYGRHFS